jgi:hypothetical protein
MANKKTSEETAAGPLTGDELVRVVDMSEPAGEDRNKRTTTGEIAALVASDVTHLDGPDGGFALIQQTRLGTGAKEVVVALVGYLDAGATPRTWSFRTGVRPSAVVLAEQPAGMLGRHGNADAPSGHERPGRRRGRAQGVLKCKTEPFVRMAAFACARTAASN